jgi:hypothetical protein
MQYCSHADCKVQIFFNFVAGADQNSQCYLMQQTGMSPVAQYDKVEMAVRQYLRITGPEYNPTEGSNAGS